VINSSLFVGQRKAAACGEEFRFSILNFSTEERGRERGFEVFHYFCEERERESLHTIICNKQREREKDGDNGSTSNN